MANDTKTQNQIIKAHLIRFGSINTFEAIDGYRITRLSTRIWDLRHAGSKIATYPQDLPNGVRVARYVYLGEVTNEPV